MDRFPSMHNEDIDKLGIPQQQAGGNGEGGWKGRKRARELSELRGALDRAAEKEQKSWDLLKQAVGSSGSGNDDGGGRFQATASNRAAEEMRERTVGLVTAAEFRKAREAADSREQEAEKQREDQRAAREAELEAARKKTEKKKRKAEEKKQRLEKSKMSFALEDDEVEDQVPSKEREAISAPTAVRFPPPTPAEDKSGASGESTAGGSSSAEKPRDLKGAAADEDNSSAAAKLKARLAR